MTRINLAPPSFATRVTALPATPVDGQECYLAIPASGNQSAAVWHMRYYAASGKWEYIGGPPIAYQMEGANSAYMPISTGGQITVNAANNQVLGWTFVPPVDCWVELDFWLGLVQKTDANYHYAQYIANCSPAPVAGLGITGSAVYLMQHASVQTYEPYTLRKRWALAAGISYFMYTTMQFSGGTWQYNQQAQNLWMLGKAWPR